MITTNLTLKFQLDILDYQDDDEIINSVKKPIKTFKRP